MKYAVVCVAFSALVAASPAVAANGTGPRVEARVGYDRTTLKLGYEGTSDSGHRDGVGLGIEAGYDLPVSGQGILGVYAGIEGATTKVCSPVYGNDEACLKLGRNLTAGVRAGFRASPSVALFVKGGYSNGQLRATYVDYANSSYNGSGHANRDGYHLGGGVEYSLSPTTYVRAEYVRIHYSTYDEPTLGVSLGGHRDQAVMAFGLRF